MASATSLLVHCAVLDVARWPSLFCEELSKNLEIGGKMLENCRKTVASGL